MDYVEYERVRNLTLGRGIVIAIDGPSGSGKSTIARQVAAALDMGYLDTGAMYRAAAWWCQYQQVDLDNSEAVIAAVEAMDLSIQAVPHAPRVLVGGMDVNKVIREVRISQIVSSVAGLAPVRRVLGEAQRKMIAQARESGRGIVVEGRDITTVIAPEAQVRILLTAAEDVRLARRSQDDQGSIEAEALEAERDLVIGRDAADSRVSEFMEPAEGVLKIDSTELSMHDTVDAVIYKIAQSLE